MEIEKKETVCVFPFLYARCVSQSGILAETLHTHPLYRVHLD